MPKFARYLLFLIPFYCNSQSNQYFDSLKAIITKIPSDTQKVNILNELAFEYLKSDNKISSQYANEALKIAYLTTSQKHIANCFNIKGTISGIKGDFTESIDNFEKALAIRESINDKLGISKTLGNLGTVYWNLGDFPKSMGFHLRSLKLKEELGNKQGIANSLGNIANLYASLKDYKKSLYYNLECIKIAKELQNNNTMLICYGNIGINFMANNEYLQALYYINKAIELSKKTGNKQSLANEIGNSGLVYLKLKDLKKAETLLTESLKMREELGDVSGLASIYSHFGELKYLKQNYNEAEKSYLKGLELARKIGIEARERDVMLELSTFYENTGKPGKSLKYYKDYIKLKEALINLDNEKLITQKQMNYEFDKKLIANTIKTEEAKKTTLLKFKQEKTLRYILFSGLIVTVIFGLVMFNRFRITKKQKSLIEEQKKLVEFQKNIVDEKQKEILDSIHYAKRIQQSLLPSKNYLFKNLNKN